MAACMKQTYGQTRQNFTRSERAKALQEIACNSSGAPAPDRKVLMAEMKSRKQHGKTWIFNQNQNPLNGNLCIVPLEVLGICPL